MSDAAAPVVTDAEPNPSGLFALELAAGREGLPRIWRRRSATWQIRLRWAVAPLMIAAALCGRLLGFEFPLQPILAVAVGTFLYNSLFAIALRFFSFGDDRRRDRLLAVAGAVLDYASMFLLIHLTGGAGSPLSIFLIFHIIIAAIQFTATGAYALAGVAAVGLWLFLAGQTMGWLVCPVIGYRGAQLDYLSQPVLAATNLAFFTATLFITAGIVSRIVVRLRSRVGDLAETTSRLARANDRLNSLYRMLSTIGAEKHMQPVLTAVTAELGEVANVPAVAVKLLTPDGQALRYVAVHGLPGEFIDEIRIPLATSAVNRRVIENREVVVAGPAVPLGPHLADLGIRSAVLAPLKLEDRVIGSLGFYDRRTRHLDAADRSFLELAAELVAIAIDHAQAYEKVQDLMRDRADFMLEVTHNLRAPLAASLGLLSLLLDDLLGELNSEQREHLERVQGRLRSLNETIGELLAIARTRDRSREIEDVVVDLGELAKRTEELFARQAADKEIALRVRTEPGLPTVESGLGILEQIMENLVSNSLKYTPRGGRIDVRFERDGGQTVVVEVKDSGIGIPAAEQDRLFEQFFRASNARKTTAYGTGLGLVFVQQAVERQGGSLELRSHEGHGTSVKLTLPTRASRSRG
jgi:signal transduction histidine kinase